ncbi:uncharacterized protein N7479_006061 [Penicillium vulpinum]|uniref:DUF7703 domain-containing protein n=1 Tax=Penicillium vulpinum TaxID=29845 RepID=A0A1V6SE82_9EURO|nr:uncharacterized protein N7479_006061 [Penicillium vulpinum]KAJ5958911.1 hypothetical protein N7479_006061 [Penicillium vulpinum]OQE12034.1 hypothetical protein PENVUL_c001G01664 [Penicillium vulpinum]
MSDFSVDGVIGEYSGQDFSVKATFTVFLCIALYNSLELLVLIFASFRRYRGLYFWSLLCSTLLGVIPQSLSFLLKYYNIGPLWFSLTLSTIGWYFMVTGQALVLFSRLNIVVQDLTVSRLVLAMIVIDAIVLHVPTTVLTYGSNFISTPVWTHGYTIMERIELTGFCLQEFIISGIYISKTIEILRMPFPSTHGHNPNRKIMYQLLVINALIIMMDVVLLVFEYMNYFVIQTTLKSMVYSIKLKLEFGVLSRLVFLVQSHRDWPQESREFDDLL